VVIVFLFHFRPLNLVEILDLLENDDETDGTPCEIFIEPPEVNQLTDEDSDKEDGVNYNCLSRNQLLAPAERREMLYQGDVIDTVGESTSRSHKERLRWQSGGKTQNAVTFPNSKNNERFEGMTEVELFELFFDDDLIEMIIDASSEYCVSNKWEDIKLNKEEFRSFLAILIISGYNVVPGKAMYWNNGEDLRNTAVYESMRRDRFDNIMRSLHFLPNDKLDKKDKFSKLRPLISHIQQKCMEMYTPSSSISHDEAMVEYFGKHGSKQMIKNKPIRIGYKIWCQNSPNGYLIAFDPYQGKTYQGDAEMEKKFGKCSSTVLHLLNQYSLDKKEFPYHIFCDNLFTSFPLLMELKQRGYECTGTMRVNRLGSINCLTNTKIMEKKTRGYSEVVTNDNGIMITRWKDNSVVTLGSTCLASDPEGTVKRYSKNEQKYISVSIPHSIQIYNQNMGGTDRMNQNINKYRVSIRGKKWWWPLFTWMLDASIQNAWILSRSVSEENITQLQFRRNITLSYLKEKKFPKKAGRKAKRDIGKEISRYDGMEHYVEKTANNKQRRCAGRNCSSKVRSQCKKCNVGLCLSCFAPYHNIE
jgi:DNA excision repair protein ERCC-6